MFRIVRAMYEEVKCRVRHCQNYSDFIEISVGLKQGEICSPLLYSLFVEDLELYLQNRPESGLSINDITLILLLYADDMVLLSESPSDLQHSLDNLKVYCDKWGLSVNTEKTKIMVFRKGGRLNRNEKWIYGDKELEIVSNFNYLGVVFSTGGSFSYNQTMLSGKALKAMNVLLNKLKTFNFTLKTYCQLFDSFVTSILSYGSEVWGNTKSKEIERIHLKFLKRILGVKISTSNASLYGELGRYPLYIEILVSCIRIKKMYFKLCLQIIF